MDFKEYEDIIEILKIIDNYINGHEVYPEDEGFINLPVHNEYKHKSKDYYEEFQDYISKFPISECKDNIMDHDVYKIIKNIENKFDSLYKDLVNELAEYIIYIDTEEIISIINNNFFGFDTIYDKNKYYLYINIQKKGKSKIVIIFETKYSQFKLKYIIIDNKIYEINTYISLISTNLEFLCDILHNYQYILYEFPIYELTPYIVQRYMDTQVKVNRKYGNK